MMAIDTNTIKYLTKVAAIKMDAEELEAHRRHLEQLADFAGCLAELDTKGMIEQTHPFGTTGDNRLREDEVTNRDNTETLVAAAPDRKGPYFRVPRTVEE